MLQIGSDKLYTLTEIVGRVRDYLSNDKDVQQGDIDKYAFEIKLLAVALNEDEDFVKGALKPWPGRSKRSQPKEEPDLEWLERYALHLNEFGRGRLAELRAAKKG